ncbi:MAG: hypothetical protein GY913_30040 [Proteobacteria bacterium]|nr:hypothetical protein [Pseudomonadota bacterium]MCP4921158.1 hypothetical protein [Pseudomonadota bacterium]
MGAASCLGSGNAPDRTCDAICADLGGTCYGVLFYGSSGCSGSEEFDDDGGYCDDSVLTMLQNWGGPDGVECACAI